jgi:hypothetical protein
MSGQKPWSSKTGGRSVSSVIGDPSFADPIKVSQWLDGADEFQCKWAVRYLWNQIPNDSPELRLGDWSPGQFEALVDWMLCGEGSTFGGTSFPGSLHMVRRHGADYFAKARNAWNQRINRQRKAERAANTITVDADTKRKIQKLAAEHNLKGDEFLSILIDLIAERRGAVEGILRQRKEAKKAALASDLGWLSQSTKGNKSSL